MAQFASISLRMLIWCSSKILTVWLVGNTSPSSSLGLSSLPDMAFYSAALILFIIAYGSIALSEVLFMISCLFSNESSEFTMLES